jgi:hypothetical protein
MKKTFLFLFSVLITTNVIAQNKYIKKTPEIERAYPWYGFTLKAGAGMLPFGSGSINQRSNQSASLNDPYTNHSLSPYLGISYKIEKLPIGFFIDGCFNQNFNGTDWIPFEWRSATHPDFFDGKTYLLNFFDTRSNAMNLGVMYGKEIFNGFELYAKLGIGNSWHNYTVHYYEFGNINRMKRNTFQKQTQNYQACIDFTYFPVEFYGFSGSFGISNNFPIATLSSALKLGYKAKAKNM